MNAERLNIVVKAIQGELASSRLLENLTELATALQNQVNQPTNASYQQIVASKWGEIAGKLRTAESNAFSPGWRQVTAQIGAEGLLGLELEERLRSIFERNQITISVALGEIRQIQQALTNLKAGIDQTAAGLQQLEIGAEELEPGEAEVGIEIPRKAVNNDLAGLEKELGEVKLILEAFIEFSTGKPSSPSLRTISSTDLQFYFSTAPYAAAAIAYAIKLLVEAYDKVLDIRKKHSELKADGVPSEALKPLEDYANGAIREKLDDFVAEIDSKYCTVEDGHRRNELKSSVKISLAKLAMRIDRGFHIEARVGPPPAASAEETEGDRQYQEAAETIKAATPSMMYIRLEGEPILSLPEATPPEAGGPKKGTKKS